MKMLSIIAITIMGCIFSELTLAAYSNIQSDDGRIISERVVKSPWNADKLSPGTNF